MPTAKDYQTLDETQRRDLRERERLAQRKAAGGVAPPSAAPAAKPYAPPLTVQEITQKFMGGPSFNQPGIPQQSAQNPAPKPQSPAPQPTPAAPASQPIDSMAARRARVSGMATQRDYKRAYDSGAGADELNRIGQNMDDYRAIDAGYQAKLSGAPGPAFTQERTDAGRARLEEQKRRLLGERNGQPLPGDTDTWTYEAGQRALPPELRGQKFTHPQDQANYREFSRWAGQAPSIDPATGMMTRPVDQEHAHVQNLREQEMLARRKMAQPIDFAPFDPEEAQRNQARATDHYNSILARAEGARARAGQREGDYRTTAEAPVTVGAQAARAQLAEQERLRAKAQSDTRLIPSQEAATNAESGYKTAKFTAEAGNVPAMSTREKELAMAAASKAQTDTKMYPREAEARIGAMEGDAALKKAMVSNALDDADTIRSASALRKKIAQSELANAATNADITSSAPEWTGSQYNLVRLDHIANAFSGTEALPSRDTQRELDNALQMVSELERNWPKLSPAQRQHIQQRLPVVDLTDRPKMERFISMFAPSGTPRGQNFEAMRARLSLLQQRIDHLRAGSVGG